VDCEWWVHYIYYVLYTSIYISFSLLLWVIFPIGYQYNIRFQNLILYVLILILCIDVEEDI